MTISKKIGDIINKQINHELDSSYLYLAMSAYFESNNLKGFAHWMKLQAKEELSHAMKFYDYLLERGGKVKLEQLGAQPSEWESPLRVFEEALKHEKKVTSLINNMVDLSIAEKDHATKALLDWFVTEQVEEEAAADEIVQKLRMIKQAPGGLLMMDHRLAKRGKE
ncbi:MAG: ferritin [Candidatus Aenigmatarchaeota archaeon]|nr:ferritin [Nanoarchaeota archaeon]